MRLPGRVRRTPRIVLVLALAAATLPVAARADRPALDLEPTLRLASRAAFTGASRQLESEVGRMLRHLLARTNRYALTTWTQEWMRGGRSPAWSVDTVVAKGNLTTEQLRRYSSVALQLAATLGTGAYDAEVTGVDAAEAARRTAELVAVLVRTHAENLPATGWGGGWQSAMWASQAALAGWLVQPHLLPGDDLLLARMLAAEADHVVARPMKLRRDRAGRLRDRNGDSGAEELAWDALGVFTAVELLPHHPRRAVWAEDAYRRFLNAYARPVDVGSRKVVNGRPLRAWLSGSNVEPNGFVVNHGKLNPDYTVDIALPGAAVAALAGSPVPDAVLQGARELYRAMIEVHFPAPPHRPPGGTFYVPRRATLYYPFGADWGTQRQVVYGTLDAKMWLLNLDRRGEHWARKHLGHVRKLQARHPDGRIHDARSEDRYFGREEHAGSVLAWAHLTAWLAANRMFRRDAADPLRAKLPV